MESAHILIIEDEFLIAEVIRRRLLEMNHEVMGITDSGKEGVQLAEALRPDLVLMDVRLNGSMDGFEAGRLIAQSLGCPIVYVTSNPRATEMRYWVRKPFTTVMLTSTVNKALRERSGEPPGNAEQAGGAFSERR